jgi:hypothetical protein
MERKGYGIAAAAVVCLAGVLGVKAFGQLSEKQWSLAEINTVSVFVQGLTEETEKAGLKAEWIKAEVQKRLEKLGIQVVPEEEATGLAGSPVVYVNISAFKRERVADYVYHVDLGLLQQVSLVRDAQIRIMGITWRKGRLGYCRSRSLVKSVRETLAYLMEGFSEDYRQANAKL